MRVYQEKVQKKAEMDYETFIKECQAFQNSRYYYLGVCFMFIIGVVYMLVSAALICMPMIVAANSNSIWQFFALLPLTLAGIFLFWNAIREQSFWNQYLRK